MIKQGVVQKKLDENYILQKIVQYHSNFDIFWMRYLVNIC